MRFEKIRIIRLKIICWIKRKQKPYNYEKEYLEKIDLGWELWGKDIEFILEESIKKFRGKTVLEIGCGNGEAMKKIQAKGFEVEGCEISEHCIKVCKSRDLNVWKYEFNNGRLEKKYDTIYSNDLVEHLYKDQQGIERMLDAANKQVIVVTPNCSFVKSHLHYYEAQDIAKMCKRICSKRNDVESFSMKFIKNVHLPTYIIVFTKVQGLDAKNS